MVDVYAEKLLNNYSVEYVARFLVSKIPENYRSSSFFSTNTSSYNSQKFVNKSLPKCEGKFKLDYFL